jgi:hypothetical protein
VSIRQRVPIVLMLSPTNVRMKLDTCAHAVRPNDRTKTMCGKPVSEKWVVLRESDNLDFFGIGCVRCANIYYKERHSGKQDPLHGQIGRMHVPFNNGGSHRGVRPAFTRTKWSQARPGKGPGCSQEYRDRVMKLADSMIVQTPLG